MAGQGIDRRDALRHLARAASASAFAGFSRWAFAFAPQPAIVRPPRYAPRFFTAQEFGALEALTELIIPSDSTPGAREAGVAEFIDFMVSEDRSLQYKFRYGLAWLEARSRAAHGVALAQLGGEAQVRLLEPLAYASRFEPGQEDGRAFFQLLRDYTVMGFYTTRIGLEELEYPGLRSYAASPECPHTADPEHRQLRPRDA